MDNKINKNKIIITKNKYKKERSLEKA